ncbi:hypothetical protein CW740_08795 [Kangiella profundi]|uniref:Uncharacterized protein n=1 Tax=Kangiella profundi TaxID=1561924 RepID=A0A2K9B337_9GAMM|nr:putative metal-binding motif-containing protein [Kangiella profundi]AUD79338.1 hypothetical protein CW740_08795 [Kangiella profundi]MBD3668899.1 putative metal-binding motif-containing protein [Kangiella sp.]GGE99438.1 hypothetical protein GCM10011356_11470 [Kangiella profundi]
MNKIVTLILASITLFLASILGSSPVYADAVSDAIKFCNEYERRTGVRCEQQRCPCGRTTKEVERWDRGGLRLSVCACVSKADLKAAANAEPEIQCRRDSDCDDGVFCNGKEMCRSGQCRPGTSPCDGVRCYEREKMCEKTCEDKDGDGFEAIHCGGNDCDDNNPNRYPGNKEICDSKGIDEDCDATTVGDLDVDGDGFISSSCR